MKRVKKKKNLSSSLIFRLNTILPNVTVKIQNPQQIKH